LAGQYDIEHELGAGGMAHVFLANDVKHDRMVAVKVFRPELATSLGSERFLREIQIAAKLSHPHILPLYDSGEADGFLYYVMPLVEGESLGDRMEREGQLPYDDALQITRETADALNYAHARGLVHRDIKPDNIMLTGGHAVVMDFGIARAVSAAGGDKLTQTGMAVGTPMYMSPEQAAAVDEVDGRTDIYALGCVLYEMLTGTPPFTGPTPQAVMARHSMDHVPSPVTIRETISPELEEVIYCAMAKSPADRFRTAGDFAEALQVLQTGTGTLPRMSTSMARPSRITPTTPMPMAVRRGPSRRTLLAASIAVLAVGAATYQFGFRSRSNRSLGAAGPDLSSVAVLYLDDLSPDGQLEYLADGLTEGLIRQLTRVSGLDVVSRNGVARFRDADVPVDSIARFLQVGSVLRGSIEPSGDEIRVNVRLLDGASGADFERAAFTLPVADLLALQDSLAREVSRLLREWIGEEVRVREQRASTTSNDAWALVQRGERLRKEGEERFGQQDPDGMAAAFDRADSVLAVAAEADPEWAEPLVLRARLAYTRASRLARSAQDAVRWIEEAVAWANRALESDPNAAEALEVRGTARYRQWLMRVTPDPDAAQRLFENAQADLEAAVQADPTLASAHSTLSHLYYQTGDLAAVVLAARRAYEEDAYLSVAPDVLWRLFLGSHDLEQLTQATRWCDEGNRRFVDSYRFLECRLMLLTTNTLEPDVGEAWRLLDEATALTPDEAAHHRMQMLVGGVIARAGLGDSAETVLVDARAGPEIDRDQGLLLYEARMRILMGDDDGAVALIRQYEAANPGHFTQEGERGWWWRDLQDHPEFRELERSGR
jgi:serine/threonine-protein kinase